MMRSSQGRPRRASPCALSSSSAAENPPVTSAKEATSLEDDAIVFGIEINGEAHAY